MRKISISILLLIAFFMLGASFDEETAPGLYLKGTKLFRSGDYAEATKVYLALVKSYPKSRYTPDAVFKIGEGYYRQKQYEKGGGYFRLYLERYTLGKNANDAKIRLAQCQQATGTQIAAAHPEMEIAAGPVRAVSVDRFFQKDMPSLDRQLAAFRDQGAKAVIVPAYHFEGRMPHGFADQSADAGAYYRTEKGPVAADVLPTLATMTHKYGLKIFATLPVRSLPAGSKDLQWDLRKNALSISGKMDLFSDEALEEMKGWVTDLCRVSLDGLILTDLALSPLEGYGPMGMKLYENGDTTFSPEDLFENVRADKLGFIKYDLAKDYSDIAKIKSSRVTQVARILAQEAKKTNPNLSVYVLVSNKTAAEPAEGLLWDALDLAELAKPPLSGVFFMMDWGSFVRGSSLTEGEVFASMKRVCESAAAAVQDPARLNLMVNVQDPVSKKPLPDWKIAEAVFAGKHVGEVGLAAYPLTPGFDYRKVFEPVPISDSP